MAIPLNQTPNLNKTFFFTYLQTWMSWSLCIHEYSGFLSDRKNLGLIQHRFGKNVHAVVNWLQFFQSFPILFLPFLQQRQKTIQPSIRIRSRFEFQVGHSNQSATLNTDQKYTFIFFPTSYQNYENWACF